MTVAAPSKTPTPATLLVVAADPVPQSDQSRIRSDWAALSSRAARHPWARPALHSSDRRVRRRVREFFAGHLQLLELRFGPPSLGVRVRLAHAANALEAALTASSGGEAHARAALRDLKDAQLLACAEDRALRAREAER